MFQTIKSSLLLLSILLAQITVHAEVPSASERAANKNLVSVKALKNLELVRSGVVNEAAVEPLREELDRYSESDIADSEAALGSFQYLQIRNVSLDLNFKMLAAGGKEAAKKEAIRSFMIPFYADLRYEEKPGYLGQWGLKGANGTLEIKGKIAGDIYSTGRIHLKVVEVENSSWFEYIGKQLYWIDSDYNSDFARAIVTPVLLRHFSSQEGRETLIKTMSLPNDALEPADEKLRRMIEELFIHKKINKIEPNTLERYNRGNFERLYKY